MSWVIETSNLTKVFDGKAAVSDVNLSVPEGSIYGIVGANGAGKSTLLRMLTGVFRPTGGEVRVFGEPLPADAAEVRQWMHYVGADGDLFRTFRVRDMLHYASLLYKRWDAKRCDVLMDALELPKNLLVRKLSLGMKMQLRLAIALAARPDLMILDEPTNGLDPIVKRQFLQLIVQEVAGAGTTVVLATHQLDDLERLADGIGFMYRGNLTGAGMLEDMKERMKRIHVVLPQGLPDELHNHPAILETEQKGPLLTVVVNTAVDEVVAKLHAAGGTHLEIAELGVEEMFRYTMAKEGYVRDGILLP